MLAPFLKLICGEAPEFYILLYEAAAAIAELGFGKPGKVTDDPLGSAIERIFLNPMASPVDQQKFPAVHQL